MKVKICGITDEKSLYDAIEAGADAIGFVFANSKRKITIEKAINLSYHVPPHILKIGVFVNETEENIKKIFTKVSLDFIQLHGDETPQFCKSIKLPVIKAFSINNMEDVDKASRYEVPYYLFDGAKGAYHGGNGETFDWNLLEVMNFPKEKIILAGGLTPKNVEEAIKVVSPLMVDVSSGVETNEKKDKDKVTEFIKLAKQRR
jgi:phosphoribosylanthranilate isomerase